MQFYEPCIVYIHICLGSGPTQSHSCTSGQEPKSKSDVDPPVLTLIFTTAVVKYLIDIYPLLHNYDVWEKQKALIGKRSDGSEANTAQKRQFSGGQQTKTKLAETVAR